MSETFTDADAKAVCAALGIETKTITINGKSHVVVDEAGMRKLADHAPIGREAGHALVDRLIAAARDAGHQL